MSSITQSLTAFNFDDHSVRTLQDESGNIWFCLADVIRAMGSKTTTNNAKASLEEVFKKGYSINIPLQTTGGEQILTFIAESATTFLISRSRTEAGKKLNRWIFTEVLPSIRKTGRYDRKTSPAEIAPQTKPKSLLDLTAGQLYRLYAYNAALAQMPPVYLDCLEGIDPIYIDAPTDALYFAIRVLHLEELTGFVIYLQAKDPKYKYSENAENIFSALESLRNNPSQSKTSFDRYEALLSERSHPAYLRSSDSV